MEIKVKSVAFSGIASTLLIDGATAHSTFKLPIPLLSQSTCNVKRGTIKAQDLLSTTIFIWDEASMIPAEALNAVDRLLQDLTRSPSPFGGKFFILGGDFRQVLPVVQHGSREMIINACVKSSPLWQHFKQFQLTTNMRAAHDAHYSQFTEWLLRIGNATEPFINENEQISLPVSVLMSSNSITKLIDHVFPEGPNTDPEYMASRCCLTPKNDNSHVINDLVVKALPGDTTTYLSIDSIITDDEDEAAAYPIEFLNTLTPSGMPLHKLELKVKWHLHHYIDKFCYSTL